ncbi:MAG: hypothetical protein HXS52_11605 [Theionarchaea archaeon]|nr:hypothetical protein [Theionarchaea archaeon]
MTHSRGVLLVEIRDVADRLTQNRGKQMNELLEKLRGGDLRSDGKADEVARKVLESRHLLPTVAQGLDDPDDVMRGRTTHVLEKISRIAPELLKGLTRTFMHLVVHDNVPMVRWHLAMIFANIELSHEETDEVVSILLHLLQDRSVFVRSWSIVTLSVLGSRCERRREEIIENIRNLKNNESVAVRSKATKALDVLESGSRMPAGWKKIHV